jgi:hypothetical protein
MSGCEKWVDYGLCVCVSSSLCVWGWLGCGKFNIVNCVWWYIGFGGVVLRISFIFLLLVLVLVYIITIIAYHSFAQQSKNQKKIKFLDFNLFAK